MENKEQSKTSNASITLTEDENCFVYPATGTLRLSLSNIPNNLLLGIDIVEGRNVFPALIKIEENKIFINGVETEDAEVIGNALKLFAKHYFNKNK